MGFPNKTTIRVDVLTYVDGEIILSYPLKKWVVSNFIKFTLFLQNPLLYTAYFRKNRQISLFSENLYTGSLWKSG